MIGYERGWDEKDEMKKGVCGINLIMEHRMSHAPKERKRISVIQDSLIFQKGLQLGNYWQKMCLNSGLKFLSMSGLSKLSSAEDDVPFDFLEKKNENFPSGAVRNVKKNWWMWLVEDNFQWGEVNPRDEISGVSPEWQSEHPSSQGPDLCWVIFTSVKEMLHGLYFFTSEASGFCSHTWLEGFVLSPFMHSSALAWRKRPIPLDGPHRGINKFEYLGKFELMFGTTLGWGSVGWGTCFYLKKPEAKFLVTLSL
jgi:hypothetical protein